MTPTQVGYPYIAHGGLWVPNAGASITPGSAGALTLPKLPSGVPGADLPAGITSGSQIVFADSLSSSGPNVDAAGSLWGTSSVSSFGSDEVTTFVNGKVSNAPGQLVLDGTYTGLIGSGPNAGLPGYNSGAVNTLPPISALGGQTGRAPQGFLFLPDASVDFIFEFDINIPAFTSDFKGADISLWAQGHKGRYEIDFAEIANRVFQNPGEGSAIWNILNHVGAGSQSATELQQFCGPSAQNWQYLGGKHTLSVIIHGVTNMKCYVDNTLIGTVGWAPGTPSNPVEPMGFVYSFGMRNGGTPGYDQYPTYTGTKTTYLSRAQGWCSNTTRGTISGTGEACTLSGGFVYAGGIQTGTLIAP